MLKKCWMCEEMKKLWKEQQELAEFGKEFRFIQLPESKDTIPFKLQSTLHSAPFTAIIDGNFTPYFRLEGIDEEKCTAQLSLLQHVDLKGQPALSDQDLYALQKTSRYIHIKLCSFRSITPLPHTLVGRPLPIVESKV